MKAWINGIGWVTTAGFGLGPDATAQPFITGELEIPKRNQVFAKPDIRFGRLDEFSRIGLAALAFCLRDAGREEWEEKRSIGIVAASRYGCLRTDLAYLETMLPDNGKLASPNLFAYTLPNCFLGEAALRFGLTGNTMVLNQADRSGLVALRFGFEDLIWSGQQGVLVGVSDLLPPTALAEGEECPGSLFLLLENEEAESSYGVLELVGRKFFFNNCEVCDLKTLLNVCLAVKN